MKNETAQRQEVWLYRRNLDTGSFTPPPALKQTKKKVQTAPEAAALHISNV